MRRFRDHEGQISQLRAIVAAFVPGQELSPFRCPALLDAKPARPLQPVVADGGESAASHPTLMADAER